jgi:hypothetical protein
MLAVKVRLRRKRDEKLLDRKGKKPWFRVLKQSKGGYRAEETINSFSSKIF